MAELKVDTTYTERESWGSSALFILSHWQTPIHPLWLRTISQNESPIHCAPIVLGTNLYFVNCTVSALRVFC